VTTANSSGNKVRLGGITKAGNRYLRQMLVDHVVHGRVEILAEGPAPQVEAFKHELLTGPRFSTVDQIEEINLDPSGSYASFRIEH